MIHAEETESWPFSDPVDSFCLLFPHTHYRVSVAFSSGSRSGEASRTIVEKSWEKQMLCRQTARLRGRTSSSAPTDIHQLQLFFCFIIKWPSFFSIFFRQQTYFSDWKNRRKERVSWPLVTASSWLSIFVRRRRKFSPQTEEAFFRANWQEESRRVVHQWRLEKKDMNECQD